MALVNVVNMVVLDNPTCFTNPFQFEITFECLQELEDDLEWKVVYVGSARDTTRDQVLDEILVGPVPVGVNKFVLQADAPEPSKLPPDEILGVTVVLVTCSYQEREFVRVGYYVNNEYAHPEYLEKVKQAREAAAKAEEAGAAGAEGAGDDKQQTVTMPSPPDYPQLELQHVQRQILADKPRVTKFPIPWGKQQQQQEQQQGQQQQQQDQTEDGDDAMDENDDEDEDDDQALVDKQSDMMLASSPGMNTTASTAASDDIMDME